MPDSPPQATGLRSSGPPEVLRPPLVSVRQGAVLIDPGAVGEILGRLPPTVSRVALSGRSGSSPEEESLLALMVIVLRQGGEAVVPVRPVPEAVKVVKEGWVVGSLDRSSLVWAAPPVLFERRALAGLAGAATAGEWIDPVRALLEAGGSVRAVPPST